MMRKKNSPEMKFWSTWQKSGNWQCKFWSIVHQSIAFTQR